MKKVQEHVVLRGIASDLWSSSKEGKEEEEQEQEEEEEEQKEERKQEEEQEREQEQEEQEKQEEQEQEQEQQIISCCQEAFCFDFTECLSGSSCCFKYFC